MAWGETPAMRHGLTYARRPFAIDLLHRIVANRYAEIVLARTRGLSLLFR